MVVVVAIAMLIQMLMSCDEASTETAVKNDMDLCVDVGEYCSQKILVALLGAEACLLLFHESDCPDTSSSRDGRSWASGGGIPRHRIAAGSAWKNFRRSTGNGSISANTSTSCNRGSRCPPPRASPHAGHSSWGDGLSRTGPRDARPIRQARGSRRAGPDGAGDRPTDQRACVRTDDAGHQRAGSIALSPGARLRARNLSDPTPGQPRLCRGGDPGGRVGVQRMERSLFRCGGLHVHASPMIIG